jgi:hypothetical protein
VNQDFLDFLRCLLDAGARFLVVGAHAMAAYGVPRATGDLDVWVSAEQENAARVWEAVLRFGAPIEALGISRLDLATPGKVIQFGVPPRRLDVLTSVSGLDFESAWGHRKSHAVAGMQVPFLSREDLIANKRASGRPKDLADLEVLGE